MTASGDEQQHLPPPPPPSATAAAAAVAAKRVKSLGRADDARRDRIAHLVVGASVCVPLFC